MARQSGVSTPIFDQLLREMTEGAQSPAPPPQPADADPSSTTPPAPRRRHRAD